MQAPKPIHNPEERLDQYIKTELRGVVSEILTHSDLSISTEDKSKIYNLTEDVVRGDADPRVLADEFVAKTKLYAEEAAGLAAALLDMAIAPVADELLTLYEIRSKEEEPEQSSEELAVPKPPKFISQKSSRIESIRPRPRDNKSPDPYRESLNE
jgi:hypothetical protein